MNILHALAHLLRLNYCTADGQWEGDKVVMYIKCNTCGKRELL